MKYLSGVTAADSLTKKETDFTYLIKQQRN